MQILFFRHFLLVEWNSVSLYSYQGRLLGAPKWKGMTQERLHPPCISLSCDTLVIRSQTNDKCTIKYIFEYERKNCSLYKFLLKLLFSTSRSGNSLQ